MDEDFDWCEYTKAVATNIFGIPNAELSRPVHTLAGLRCRWRLAGAKASAHKRTPKLHPPKILIHTWQSSQGSILPCSKRVRAVAIAVSAPLER
jgi:hypothetical protein